MLVNTSFTGDWTVKGHDKKLLRMFNQIRPAIARLATKFLKTQNCVVHSPAMLPSNWGKRLNSSSADIVNLHWVNNEMISISDIATIKKPLVWTLHDMWGFCGAEHVTNEGRWREGYLKKNRPDYESGVDINRLVWSRKKKAWDKPIPIIVPSQWMESCVKQSYLMKDWPVRVIPNPIDTDLWCPRSKKFSRAIYGLPNDVPLILFGAIDSVDDWWKGFSLLYEALKNLIGEVPNLELVVLGKSEPEIPSDFGFPVHYVGRLHDDVSLSLLYNSVDLVAIPSIIDNFPNIGVEAHSCGTPIVAFDVCGLRDIVTHLKTGYLAKAFDALDFADGMKWVLQNDERMTMLGTAARQKAVATWSYELVAKAYLEAYQEIINPVSFDQKN
jgi:glycosyltransferase involved in cell wall biosynthesis